MLITHHLRVLALTLVLFCSLNGGATAEDAAQRNVAIHWSPFLYQASVNNYDIPTGFDFDYDWDGYNNWFNSTFFVNQFVAKVYYSYQESTDYIFLNYLVYHPRDFKALFGHEHDLEGVQVIVAKDLGVPNGRFVAIVTFAHGSFYVSYYPQFINGSHPAVYIEAKGHGIYPYNNGIFPAGCGGMGIWYAGRGGETPDHCNDRDVSMELVSFEDTLWARRFNSETYSDTRGYVTGGWFGSSFRGHDGCKGNAPWNWSDDAGAWFLTPGYLPYLVNVYVDSSSGSVSGCPS